MKPSWLCVLLLVGCGGSTEAEPGYPTSGCPPSHEMMDGVCRVKEIYFAGGEFVMGRGYCETTGSSLVPPETEHCPFSDEPHVVRVDPFWVDATVLTDADRRPSESCPSGAIECGAFRFPFLLPPNYPDWEDPKKWEQEGSPLDRAAAACPGFGKRHLREAEWEWIATAGGTREYPWGDEEPTCDRANIDAERCGPANRDAVFPYTPGLSETARYAPSPEGVYDLIGGAPEWVGPSPAGAYPPGINYAPNPAFFPPWPDAPCDTCPKPQGNWPPSGIAPITRGGSAVSPPEQLRPAYRGIGSYNSFRCARSAE
jgi:formylglycine-generating enzyme required for sulfatase activity